MFSVPPEELDVDGELREGLARELERKGLLIFEPLPCRVMGSPKTGPMAS
jgi:hypothetical protein